MDTMRPLSPSTALSSFPVTKAASTSSMSADRSDTMISSGSISESCETLQRASSNSSDRSAKRSLDGKTATNSNQDQPKRPYKSSDFLKLETDRESVINLAKFLRTTEPPPNNYMSLPDSDPRHSQDRKLPFKMLRRPKSKRSSDPLIRTLRLPDSAVAAKTKQGHWHIAISIPVEYDHQEAATKMSNQTIKHAKTYSETAIQNGHITVLKPAIGNVRPAVLTKVHTKSQSHDDLRRTFKSTSPMSFPSLPDADAGHDFHTLSGQEVKRDVSEISKDDQIGSNQSFDNNDDVSTSELTRPESQQSGARKSEETCCTVRSLDSSLCHTRGQSSISTAPSVNYPASPRAAWPPQKRAGGSDHSIDQGVQTLQAKLPQPVADARVIDSLRPTSVGSDIASPNLKTAATARGYGPDMPGTQLVFVRKPIQSPSYRARIAKRSPKNSSAEYILSSQSSLSSDYLVAASNSAETGVTAKPRQSRQERVKAIRSRDMAKLRAMKKYQQVMASVTASEAHTEPGVSQSNQARIETYRRPAQKLSLSYASIAEETTWQKSLNSWTPVMVVANIEPSAVSSKIPVHMCQLPSRRLREREVRKSIRNSPDEAQTPPCSEPSSPNSSNEEEAGKENTPNESPTPPQSVTSSPVSSDTETVQSLKPRPRNGSAATRYRFGSIDNYRGDLKLQNSGTEESIDIRIRRLETINAVIFRTLNAVVEMGAGFRELRQLLPTEPSGPGDMQPGQGRSSQTADDRDPVGSLIRELRGAVKIGQEELAKYGAAV